MSSSRKYLAQSAAPSGLLLDGNDPAGSASGLPPRFQSGNSSSSSGKSGKESGKARPASSKNEATSTAIHASHQAHASASRKRLRAFLASVDREVGVIMRRGGTVSASAKQAPKRRNLDTRGISFMGSQPLAGLGLGLEGPTISAAAAMARAVSFIAKDVDDKGAVSTGEGSPSDAANQAPVGTDDELVSPEALRLFGLIDPNARWKILWDLFVLALMAYSVIAAAFRVGFNLRLSNVQLAISLIIDVFIAIDITFWFVTSFEDHESGRMVASKRRIALNYLKLWFWIDLLSTIPFEVVLEIVVGLSHPVSTSLNFIRIIRFAQVPKLLRTLRLGKTGSGLRNNRLFSSTYGIQKVLLQAWFFVHILCCLWFFMSTPDSNADPNDNWVVNSGLESATLQDKYVASFYYTVLSIVSVGYGDIHAYRPREMIVAIVTMVFGAVLFGIIVGEAARVMKIINPGDRLFKEKMNELKAYLSEASLPNEKRREVQDAYRYYFKKRSVFDEDAVVRGLPPGLAASIVSEAYREEISRIHLFHELEDTCAAKIMAKMKPLHAHTGEVLIRANEVANEVIFITEGSIQLCIRDGVSVDDSLTTISSAALNRSKIVGVSRRGGFVGDFASRSESRGAVRYIAGETAQCLSVTYADIYDVLNLMPDSRRKYENIVEGRYDAFKIAKGSTVVITREGLKLSRYFWVDGILHDQETDSEVMLRTDASVLEEEHFIKILRRTDGPVASPPVGETDTTAADDSGSAKKQEATNEIIVHHRMDRLFRDFGIIHPSGELKLLWDILIAALIMYNLIMVPIEVGFQLNYKGSIVIFHLLVDLCFFIEMIINFRLAFYDEAVDAMVIIPSKIAMHYLKGWFLPDLLSTIPFEAAFELVLHAHENASFVRILKTTRMLRIFRLLRLPKFKKYIASAIDSLGISPWTLELLKTLTFFLFVSHWIACAYWYLCTIVRGETWYDELNLRHKYASHQYLAAIYWTLTTTSTTGYGDIVPINTKERVIAIFVMLIGATMYLYSVSSVSELIGTFDVSSKKIQEHIKEVDGYLSERRAPEHLVQIVTKHVRHRYANESIFDEGAILSRLPSRLSRDLVTSYHQEHISNICIFPFFPDREAKVYVFQKLTPVFYETSEAIINQGFTPHGVSFINAGKAELTRIARCVRKLGDVKVEDLETLSASSSLINKWKSMYSYIFASDKADKSTQLERSYTINAAQFVKRRPTIIHQQKTFSPIDSNLPSSLRIPSDIRKFTETLPTVDGHKTHVTTFHVSVGMIEGGSMCGFGPMLTQRGAVASVIARSPCSVFLLSEEAINSMVVTEPEVARVVRNALVGAVKRQVGRSKLYLRQERHHFLNNLIADFKAHRIAQRSSHNSKSGTASGREKPGRDANGRKSDVSDSIPEVLEQPDETDIEQREEPKATAPPSKKTSPKRRGSRESNERVDTESKGLTAKSKSFLSSIVDLKDKDDEHPDIIRSLAFLRKLKTQYDSDDEEDVDSRARKVDSWSSRKLVFHQVRRSRARSFDEAVPYPAYEDRPSRRKRAEQVNGDGPKSDSLVADTEKDDKGQGKIDAPSFSLDQSEPSATTSHIDIKEDVPDLGPPMNGGGNVPSASSTTLPTEAGSKFIMPEKWTSTWQLKPKVHTKIADSTTSISSPKSSAPMGHQSSQGDLNKLRSHPPQFSSTEAQPLIVQALQVPRFARRLSFPSPDIDIWREDRILRTLV